MGQSCVNPQPGRRKHSFPLDSMLLFIKEKKDNKFY